MKQSTANLKEDEFDLQEQIKNLIEKNSTNEEGSRSLQKLSIDDYFEKLFMDYYDDPQFVRPNQESYWASIASVIIKSKKSETLQKLQDKIGDFYKKLEADQKEMIK